MLSRELCGKPIVLFRGADGVPAALDAHCWHMGAHLGAGKVVGNHVQCPLHHWEYDAEGSCVRTSGPGEVPPCARQRSYPVEERYGALFVFNGTAPRAPLPTFEGAEEGDLRFSYAGPIRIQCPWYVLASNAFDEQHLRAVHDRALREPPDLDLPDPSRLRLRILSRVTGTSVADRVTKWLSRDHIRVTIVSWGGPLLTIESDLGRTRSALLLSFHPVGDEVDVTAIFTVRRTGLGALDAIRARVGKALFTRFIVQDVEVVRDIRFRPRFPLHGNSVMEGCLRFLSALPGEESAPAAPFGEG